eukprot:COSAG01_NODE_3801_length_5684_cov_5.162936_1_plen_131_part_10
MGIQPASRHFQKWMEAALGDLVFTGPQSRCRGSDGKWRSFVAVYQDDITWWSSTAEEHWEMTQQLFARCCVVNLRLGAKKTKLFCPYARYLGCIVGQGECHLDPQRVDAVSALEVSPDPAAIRQFVGLCV